MKRVLVVLGVLLISSSASARISPEFFQRAVRARLPAIRACYDDGLRTRPELAGRVTALVALAPDGHVTSTRVVSSTLGAPDVEQCILDALATLDFPPLAGDAPISFHYPFTFSP